MSACAAFPIEYPISKLASAATPCNPSPNIWELLEKHQWIRPFAQLLHSVALKPAPKAAILLPIGGLTNACCLRLEIRNSEIRFYTRLPCWTVSLANTPGRMFCPR